MNPQVQAFIYLLCFATSLGCAGLLARSYARSRARLLLWTALCFSFLALNNLLVVFDLLILPGVDLRLWRQFAALLAVSVLLFGFVWEQE
jgi:hypothetical protein